jgi:TRAP-type C4-dicarboxylate transport system permease small subunit
MKELTIISATALRIILYFLIAIFLGSFLPIATSLVLAIFVPIVTFEECTSSVPFVICLIGGIIVALFWIASMLEDFGNKTKQNSLTKDQKTPYEFE